MSAQESDGNLHIGFKGKRYKPLIRHRCGPPAVQKSPPYDMRRKRGGKVQFFTYNYRSSMTLKEYVDRLTEYVQYYGRLEVISASDDEGNSFRPVHLSPTLGYFGNDKEFIGEQDAEAEGLPTNAICIN